MSESKVEIFDVASGEISVWVDQGVICLKLNSKFNDPVELAAFEALALSDLLIRLVREERE
jgi:hypothetical protein